MPRKIAAAVAVLFGLGTSPAGADDINYLEIDLLGYDAGLYGVTLAAAKLGATTCKLQTPGDSDGSPCANGERYVIRWDLDWDDLQAEIGTLGDDWTLTWDEGLATETIVGIDFGTVSQSDWFSLPTITNPLEGATGVSVNTSIDWGWPDDPVVLGNVWVSVYPGTLEEVIAGPLNPACESGNLPHPPSPTTWNPPCLSPGWWTAFVLNQNEYLRAVPVGLTITGDPWVPQNDEWLATDSIDFVSFNVPEPSTVLLLGFGLVGLVVAGRRRR